jgi:DNA polymerase I-like protein with 3'-5' exonuclease and polymerase domains
MDIYTLDFETYYDRAYSLSKITTEEYVRDQRFEAIGLGIKKNDEVTRFYPKYLIGAALAEVDWSTAGILCHNTMFDGAILSWRYGVRPKAWFDTLCMARAVHGIEKSASLKALTDKYGIGAKGTEVLSALGKRYEDFTLEELNAYGSYCANDVDLTWKLFHLMGKGFPKDELKLIDLTLRMFINPTLRLDTERLEKHLKDTVAEKASLLTKAGITDKADLMSNQKFAELLKSFGVSPPTKISLTTGKETLAMAKSDEGFKALAEHDDIRVQTLVAARLGNKSTLEETRTQRFIDISKRGSLPVPVRYYAAHTGRWGGDDKINLQNLPSRGVNGKKLKRGIIAPDGYTLVESDSSQIEARTLAWLAGQDDVVETFAAKGDVYKKMASKIYGVPEVEVTKDQRHVGKTTVLGAGYGMGGEKFQGALKNGFPSVDLPLHETKRIIAVYREANWAIADLWKRAGIMLQYLARGDVVPFGRNDLLVPDPNVPGVRLPNGLFIRYDGLRGQQGEKGVEYVYDTRKGPTRIYGGKVVENVTQALARIIIGEQMLRINKRYRVVLTVHDSIVCCVRDEEVDECRAFVESSMRWTPDWAEGLPVDCESGVGKNYGDCE